MQTVTHAQPVVVPLDQVPEPLEVFEAHEVVEPLETRQVAPATGEARLFQSVTRKKAPDAAVLGLVIVLHAMGLATGVWMALNVARGVAIAEHCDGKCVEAAK
jgi:hypothetical protein